MSTLTPYKTSYSYTANYDNDEYTFVDTGKPYNDTKHAIVWQMPNGCFVEFQAHPAICMFVCANNPKNTKELLQLLMQIKYTQHHAPPHEKAFYKYSFFRNTTPISLSLDATFVSKRGTYDDVILSYVAQRKCKGLLINIF